MMAERETFYDVGLDSAGLKNIRKYTSYFCPDCCNEQKRLQKLIKPVTLVDCALKERPVVHKMSTDHNLQMRSRQQQMSL
ncbi:unnamed protein product [Parnassius apollo]|uniref:(apollo) hypothetical protein n=1 Tax=Parnassius apollo TaxID=110799 RepID=A0A8S3X4L5_PARAO|nr:unnamed protein product [Parnassius apollo]